MLRVQYFNAFDKITPAVIHRLDEVVRETAATVRATASDNAPVDTRALQQSLYISGDEGSDYDRRADDAEALRHEGNRPGSPAVIVPEVKPDGPHEAIVGSAVAHAIENEFGTSHMPARPFLVPAVEGAADEFYRKIQEALDGNYRGRSDARMDPEVSVEEGGAEAGGAGEAIAGGEAGAGLEGIELLALL